MSVCADCGKPGFPDSTGALQHDRRELTGGAPDGKERRASALPPAPTSIPKPEKPPRREHWLHSKWFGLVRDS